jgi:hypothetical protein
MSLLTIIQNVTNETGLGEEPTTVIGNNDKFVKKCLALLNKVGKELLALHNWQVLNKEQTFTSDGTGSYTRASIFTDGDFERYVNNTDWDRSNYRKMQLVTPQEWQLLESSVVSTVGINRYYRESGDSVLITPDESGDTLVFEYISNYWITDSTGATSKGAFTVDSDLVKFPEFLMELGLKYRLKAGDGLPAAVEMAEYEAERARLISAETPKRIIGPKYPPKFLANLPDTGYGA